MLKQSGMCARSIAHRVCFRRILEVGEFQRGGPADPAATGCNATRCDMAELINLRLARKRAVRAKADAKAAENRRAYGVSKAERRLASAEQESRRQKLDQHRLETGVRQ
jgi:hypothetical protein